jgi:hypothetical protein
VTGCVAIGWDTLCIDCDRPGLNDISDMPYRPGGSNLSRLLQYVDELSRDQPFRAIGIPTLVDRFNGRHPDCLFQFPPFASAAEVILQREMDFTFWCEFFCAFSDDTIRNLAEDIIDDMRLLWVNAEHYAPCIEELRDAANRVVRNLREVEIHAVTIDISNQRSGGDRYFVEFDAWDDAFRRGLIVQEVETCRELESSFVENKFDENAFDIAVLGRAGKVEEVHASGADGRIGGLARAIVDAAPQGACAVLTDLADNFETFVTLSAGAHELYLRLYWQDGEIFAENRDSHQVKICNYILTLSDYALPDTVLVSLRGQPLHVVFDYPFRCQSRIDCIQDRHRKIVITVEPDRWLVQCRTGRMWAEELIKLVAVPLPRSGRTDA